MKIYPITEASEKLGVEQAFIVECIRLHWIEPVHPEKNEMDEEDVARLQLIRELQEIFGVNREAIPVILHLVDELHSLRLKVVSGPRAGAA